MDPIKRKEFLNAANYISLGRIVAVPLMVVLMSFINDRSLFHRSWAVFWSGICAIIYGAASLSDILDGFLARKYHLESTFGKFFDPLADKLLNLAVMIMLIPLGRIPAWLVILLLVREITVTMLRGVAANEHIVIPASKWGKYKNAFGSVGISLLVLHYPFFGIEWMLIGWLLLIISAAFSIGSGVNYIYRFILCLR